jgi:hypothetical protein
MTRNDETLVRDVLHRATDDLTAPATSLAATATVNGRRLRRRRRVVAAAGTVCAAALVAVPVVAALGGSNPAAGPQVATDPTPSATPTATPSVEPTPHLVDNDGWAQMPAAEMATAFEALAPDAFGLTDVHLTNDDRAPGEPKTQSPGFLMADLTVDGVPAGGVNVILYVTGQPASKYTCPGDLTKPDRCTEIRRDDGEVIGRRFVSTMGDVVVNGVVLVRSNGGLVYVASSNSVDDKPGYGSTVAGATVPLTLDQLQAIAEDDAWIDYEPPADAEASSE